MTPEAIRGEYRKHAIEWGALRLAINKTQRIIDARGGHVDALAVFNHVQIRHPEILRDIRKAKTPAAAEAAFDKFAQAVEADYERYKICDREIRSFADKVKNALVRRLGAPIENLLVDIDERYINQCGEKLMEDILDGKDPSDGEDAIKAAFENHAERFAEEYVNAFASIDGLNIPVSVKDRMKIHVLEDEKVGSLKFDRIFQAGMDLQMGNLKELLDNNAPKEDVYNALVPITRAEIEAVHAIFIAQNVSVENDLGSDEFSYVNELILEVCLSKTPGLRDAIKAFLKRPDVLADNIFDPHSPAAPLRYFLGIARDKDGNDTPSAKEHVLANLGTPQLHPIYVQALVSAVRELGRDDPPDAVLALFSAGTQAGDMLREALGQFEGELDTTTLKAFAIGVLQRQ